MTPTPDPNVRNLNNDKAQNDEQARKKIDSLYARVKQGEDFAMLAQNYSEDPDSAQDGGDVGFVPRIGAGEGQRGSAQEPSWRCGRAK